MVIKLNKLNNNCPVVLKIILDIFWKYIYWKVSLNAKTLRTAAMTTFTFTPQKRLLMNKNSLCIAIVVIIGNTNFFCVVSP